MLLWLGLFESNAQKSLLGSSQKVTFKNVVRGNKVKYNRQGSAKAPIHLSNEQVEKPGQTYKHRQRRNQLSKPRAYGPELPFAPSASICHGNARDGSKSISWAVAGQPSFHRECSSLKQDIPGRIILVYLWKACVLTFGCSHLKPFYLASIQTEHLTKLNWQP